MQTTTTSASSGLTLPGHAEGNGDTHALGPRVFQWTGHRGDILAIVVICACILMLALPDAARGVKLALFSGVQRAAVPCISGEIASNHAQQSPPSRNTNATVTSEATTTPSPPVKNISRCCLTSLAGATVCVARGLPIVWHDNFLGERGTAVAVYDYADHWERLLCGVSYIAAAHHIKIQGTLVHASQSKFEQRFPGRVVIYNDDQGNWDDLANFVEAHAVAAIYAIVGGVSGEDIRFNVPSCVKLLAHNVFAGWAAGDVTARISKVVPLWQQKDDASLPVIHHMVPPLVPYDGPKGGMRGELGIPLDATVICRHGGPDTFDIFATQYAVCQGLTDGAFGTDAWFIFLNTNKLPCRHQHLVNLPMITDLVQKRKFLATCNACLHARRMGESFGLSVAECSMAGLPVITCNTAPPDGRHHLDVLGSAAILYSPDLGSAKDAIAGFIRDKASYAARAATYPKLYESFLPENVMVQLVRVFGLSSLIPRTPGPDGTAEARAAGRCNFTHIPRLSSNDSDVHRMLVGVDGPPLTERALRRDEACCVPE